MTLRGKKNHYNVKLLRGYGVSINLKNNRIILKNGQHDITGKSETEEYFVTRMPYEKIVISGRGYVSTCCSTIFLYETIKNQITIRVIVVNTFGIFRTFVVIILSSSFESAASILTIISYSPNVPVTSEIPFISISFLMIGLSFPVSQ